MSDSNPSSKSDEKPKGLSRRSFLKGVGLTSVGVAAIPGSEMLVSKLRQVAAAGEGELLGPDAVSLTLDVNGRKMRAAVEPRTTLAEMLRDHLHLTGTKIGCDRGACGACTVLVNGRPVASCMKLAVDAAGHRVETVEGLALEGKLHEIQEAFVEHDALQCGYCTSGMLMSSKALLDVNPHPSLEEVKLATSGNLCRCGTYPKVFAAVLAASGEG